VINGEWRANGRPLSFFPFPPPLVGENDHARFAGSSKASTRALLISPSFFFFFFLPDDSGKKSRLILQLMSDA